MHAEIQYAWNGVWWKHLKTSFLDFYKTRGQSYKTFYALGQIYKRVLKHVNNAIRQTFVGHKVEWMNEWIALFLFSKLL